MPDRPLFVANVTFSEEDEEHIFFLCGFAKEVRRYIQT